MSPEFWRYGRYVKDMNILENSIFFAQDLFANQFCIKNTKIYLFDIESLEFEYISDDIVE